MKNILVPLGTSSSSTDTLQYAIDFAHEIDANVYVISIFQEFSKVAGMAKVNTLLKEESENRINDALSKVDRRDVSVIAHPIKGAIIEGVQRFDKHVPVDLMILAQRSNSVSEEEYLGKTTGALVKETNIPVLIIPDDTKFIKPASILMAFKNGVFPKKSMLDPMRAMLKVFNTKLDLLHVHTPGITEEMKRVSVKLEKLSNSYKTSVNATTYQGVLEHFQSYNPDMICVVRRKRGFFKKLWEKGAVLKREFYTTKPLLILGAQEE
jgi:nucleotide-binding universal stress UspA family protein